MRIILLIVTLYSFVFAQDKDPVKILENVKADYEKVKDYKVDVNINVDVNFLRMPKTKATIFYKAPNKLRLKSDGFALLPKAGLNFTPTKLLEHDFDAIYVKTETQNDTLLDVIKVIPKEDSVGIILTTLKVDSKTNTIRHVETTTKDKGTFSIELHYSDEGECHLPNLVVFTFNVEGMTLPASMTGDLGEEAEAEEMRTGKKRGENMEGKVIVTYKNYKVNLNLPDEIFDDEKEIPEKYLK